MDDVTNPQWPAQEPEQQWTQPPFAPGPAPQPVTPPTQQPSPQAPTQASPYDQGYQQYSGWSPRGEVTGGVLMPRAVRVPYPTPRRVPPASGTEAMLRTVASVLFPAMIVMAIFGLISWVPAIVIALVVPGILNRLTRDMKQRRIASAQFQTPPPAEDDLR